MGWDDYYWSERSEKAKQLIQELIDGHILSSSEKMELIQMRYKIEHWLTDFVLKETERK